MAVNTFDLHVHREDMIMGDDYHVGKSIFLLSFQQGSALEAKVHRICESFPGEMYEINVETITEKLANA